MIGPELLADVGKLEPGVHQDAFAVAGLNEALQPGVGLRIRLEVVPGGDVEGGDSGFAPARREVIHIHARAVGGIEESPKAVGAEGWVEAEIGEGVEQIGKALAAVFAGRGGHPQDGARTALHAGGHGCAGPTFAGEDLGALRNVEHG